MEKIRVFLSSAMSDELKTERAVLKERFNASPDLSNRFELYLFEDNAAPNPAQAVYVREVERSAIVIFVFAETLRDGVAKEFDAATRGSHIFCYFRGGATRTSELDRFIADRVSNKVQYAEFSSPEDLSKRVESDINNWIVRLVMDARPPELVAALGSSTAKDFCDAALADPHVVANDDGKIAVDLSAHSLWGTVRPRGTPGLPFDRQHEIRRFDAEIDDLRLNGAVFPALFSSTARGLRFAVRVLLLHPESDQARLVDGSQRASADTTEQQRFALSDIYLTLYVLGRLSRQHPELGLASVRVLSADDAMDFALTRIDGRALVTPYPNDFLLEHAASYSVKGAPGDLTPFAERVKAFEDLWHKTEKRGHGYRIDLETLPGEFPEIVHYVDKVIQRKRPLAQSSGHSDPTPFGTRTSLLTLYRAPVQAYWNGGDPYPVALEVNPANFCDQGCHWCISENAHTPGSSIDFEHARFEAFMVDFHRLGGRAVGWSGGGEPTRHPQLAVGMDIVKSVGLAQGLITHGAFSDELIRPVVDCCDWVRVSLDTNNRNDYARKRGRSMTAGSRAFDKVVKNVKALVAAGAHVGLNMNVARWNLEQVENCYDWSVSLRVKYLQVRPTLLTPFPHASAEDLLSDEERRSLLKRLGALERRARGSETKLIVSHDKFEDVGKSNYGRSYKGCNAHRLFVVLNAGGDLAVCMYQMTDRRFILGNIYEDSLKEIWQSERRKEVLRFCSKDLKHDVHECQICCKGHEINKVLDGQFSGLRGASGARPPFI
jgi:cyclic pyranopterin phosphate synthase